MAATDAEIVNLALNNLGLTQYIATLADATKEARAALKVYAPARKRFIARWPWKFAQRRAVLAVADPLVADELTTLDGWAAVYKVPATCIKAIKFFTGYRTEAHDDRAPFELGMSDDGSTNVILCDLGNSSTQPILHFRIDVTDPTKFPYYFDDAFSWEIADLLAMPLRVDEKIAKLTKLRAAMALESALADQRSERYEDEEPDAEHIRARI